MEVYAISRLSELMKVVPGLLDQLSEEIFSLKPDPGRWSKKEILGHLIDSATNNHHRFVRSQFEHIPVIAYQQDEWNKSGYYQAIDKRQLVEFWASYNRQLLELMKNMPEEHILKLCSTGTGNVTLEALFDDYVRHLEHHLEQIIDYKELV